MPHSVSVAPRNANSTPPIAGPSTAPICHAELLHADAFGYTSRGVKNPFKAKAVGL